MVDSRNTLDLSEDLAQPDATRQYSYLVLTCQYLSEQQILIQYQSKTYFKNKRITTENKQTVNNKKNKRDISWTRYFKFTKRCNKKGTYSQCSHFQMKQIYHQHIFSRSVRDKRDVTDSCHALSWRFHKSRFNKQIPSCRTSVQ